MVNIYEEPKDEDQASIKEFSNKVFATASESVEWSTAPLAHLNYETNSKVSNRSGVLLEIADMQFLITAAHGMIELYESGNILNILLPEKGADSVPLIKERFWSSKNPDEDICVCKLLPDTVRAMGTGFRFLRLNQLMSQYDSNQFRGFYLILGYPEAMIRIDSEDGNRFDPWKYLATPFQRDYANVSNYDEQLHLVLDYDRQTINRDGNTVHPPGLSGCGVYFAGHPTTHALLQHDDLKLVGIQVAWHKGEQYAKVVWINNVLQILWRYYSDTRNPMRFHGIEF